MSAFRGCVCGYEDACGKRELLECPYSVCDGCPLKPGADEPSDEPRRIPYEKPRMAHTLEELEGTEE